MASDTDSLQFTSCASFFPSHEPEILELEGKHGFARRLGQMSLARLTARNIIANDYENGWFCCSRLVLLLAPGSAAR